MQLSVQWLVLQTFSILWKIKSFFVCLFLMRKNLKSKGRDLRNNHLKLKAFFFSSQRLNLSWLESWDSKLSNAYLVWPVALLVLLVLCQIVYPKKMGVRNFWHPRFWHQDYKSYTIWHKTKTNKATGQTRYALKCLESQLFNAHLVYSVALLVFVLCQIVYNL